MITVNDLQLLGSGATADVYLFEKDKIIKLFHQDYSYESVLYEAKIASEINKSVSRVPKFYTTIQCDERHGIIYEFIPGELLVSLLLRSSLSQGIYLTKELVKTQISINNETHHAIPSQIDRLTYLINNANNIDQYKNDLINGLRSIKQDGFICHGDLHAGNVIVANSELITIDWMNCYAGNKEGDLIRSVLMLTTPYMPFFLGPVKTLRLKIYKIILGYVYLKEYLHTTGLKKKALRKWYPIIAAARIADKVPNEEQWLIRLIQKNIKYLTSATCTRRET